jgi:hypothetical protein
MNDMLSWLLVGHMAGDYLFQTSWMATQKTKYRPALAIHAAVYACSVWIASLPAGGLSPFPVLFLFVTHAIVDERTLTLWWCKHITKSKHMWLAIMTDQTIHVVILALTCLLEQRTGGWWF